MEMPKALDDKRTQYYRKRQQDADLAIQNDLNRIQAKGGRAIEAEFSSNTTVGKRPTVGD